MFLLANESNFLRIASAWRYPRYFRPVGCTEREADGDVYRPSRGAEAASGIALSDELGLPQRGEEKKM